MEEQITKSLIESTYPFWITIILFAVISGLIQCIISFFIERGKNLATKKDISDITDKIESVKDSYNKALEAHKIELQKEFESHKYIMRLCHSLDETLLQHISTICLFMQMRPIDCFNFEEYKQTSHACRLPFSFRAFREATVAHEGYVQKQNRTSRNRDVRKNGPHAGHHRSCARGIAAGRPSVSVRISPRNDSSCGRTSFPCL